MGETPQIPTHIAVIMDGNGRWATERGLPRIKGHEAGANSVKACVEVCCEQGVKFLTLYAFSSENWKRSKFEVSALMELLERFLREKTGEMMEKDIRFDTIGNIEGLPTSCQREIARTKERTANNKRLRLIFALNYGSRKEITDAVRDIAREVKSGTLDPDAIDENTLSARLDTRDLPDPDLLIRTSGEMRISNFLLWQLSYTELYITRTLWPDFGKPQMLEAIAEYGRRHRRFGGV
jgi:undecaprenyl diphosphate synthase